MEFQNNDSSSHHVHHFDHFRALQCYSSSQSDPCSSVFKEEAPFVPPAKKYTKNAASLRDSVPFIAPTILNRCRRPPGFSFGNVHSHFGWKFEVLPRALYRGYAATRIEVQVNCTAPFLRHEILGGSTSERFLGKRIELCLLINPSVRNSSVST